MSRISSYTIDEIPFKEPEELFNSVERGKNPAILLGKGPKDISKTAIIGLNPYRDVYLNSDVFNKLRELNNSTNFHQFPSPINELGAIGSLSYEALHQIEDIEKITENSYEFPILNWTIYSTYYYFDMEDRKCWIVNLRYENRSPISLKSKYTDSGFSVENIESDFSPTEYKENVEKIRNHIYNGNVYEVNLTQGLRGDFKGSPLSLFNKLYSINSSPYSAYIERDNYTIVSNSPELFLRCRGNIVETRPIKGTAPRSLDINRDNELASELYNSDKNQAELFMIVDLMRNDLSKVSKVGSVVVKEKKRIEHYKNVHHLVSIVQSELKESMDYIDLLKATFPGGSITGCPKVRCIKITEEIEKSSRNLYTGTIFLMNRELFNSNIVIRTSVIKDCKIFINSGGAITIDSDPNEEYLESKVKLKSILKAVGYEDSI